MQAPWKIIKGLELCPDDDLWQKNLFGHARHLVLAGYNIGMVGSNVYIDHELYSICRQYFINEPYADMTLMEYLDKLGVQKHVSRNRITD